MSASLATSGISARRIKNAYDTIAASQTDAILVAAITGRSIRVVAAFINNTDAGVGTVTFKSKGAGAGTAISPPFQLNTKSGAVLPDGGGWFETGVGEALALDTAAASATSIMIVYEVD